MKSSITCFRCPYIEATEFSGGFHDNARVSYNCSYSIPKLTFLYHVVRSFTPFKPTCPTHGCSLVEVDITRIRPGTYVMLNRKALNHRKGVKFRLIGYHDVNVAVLNDARGREFWFFEHFLDPCCEDLFWPSWVSE